MPVLLTRPEEASRELARALAADGIDSLIWPLTRIEVRSVPEVPAGTGALLFTSANAVRVFAADAARRDLPALCVGGATATAARSAGFAEVRAAGGDAQALAALALETGIEAFFHPRGHHAAGNLAGALSAAGRRVTEVVVYEAVETGAPPATVAAALAAGEVAMITVWSPRSAEILARRLPAVGARLAGAGLIAISAAAARPLMGAGFAWARVAATPNGAAMLAAIRTAVAESRQ